jgi:hypothetical protein
MRQATWLLVATVALGTFPGDSVTHSQEAKRPAAEPPQGQPKSKLYEGFDALKLKAKYAAHFDKRDRTTGAVANLTITPPGDVFNLFRIKGDISDEELKEVLSSLRSELSELAKASGVKVVHEPKETMGDRPIALLTVLFLGDTVELKTVQGFYFTYEQDKIRGVVDVFAARCVAGEKKQWKIVCAVHEPAR